MTCLVCSNPTTDRCHIVSRGAGGSDQELNIMPLCRTHHQEQHRRGILTFVCRYPRVLAYLKSQGWMIIDQVGKAKLFHPDLKRVGLAVGIIMLIVGWPSGVFA